MHIADTEQKHQHLKWIHTAAEKITWAVTLARVKWTRFGRLSPLCDVNLTEAGEAWLGTLKRRYRGFKISPDSGLGAAAPAAPCTANGGSAAGGLTQWFLSNTDTTPTTSTIQEEVSWSRARLGWGKD